MQTELKLAARETASALKLALSSHGIMLLCMPPREAWQAYDVEGRSRRALERLESALADTAPLTAEKLLDLHQRLAVAVSYKDFEIIARAVETAQGIVTGAEDDKES